MYTHTLLIILTGCDQPNICCTKRNLHAQKFYMHTLMPCDLIHACDMYVVHVHACRGTTCVQPTCTRGVLIRIPRAHTHPFLAGSCQNWFPGLHSLKHSSLQLERPLIQTDKLLGYPCPVPVPMHVHVHLRTTCTCR